MQKELLLACVVGISVLGTGCGLNFQADREFVSFGYRAYTYDDFRAVNLAEIAEDVAAGRTPSATVTAVGWRATMDSLIGRVRANPALFGFDDFMEGALHTMGARNYQQTWPDFFTVKCRAEHAPGTEFEFEVPDGTSVNADGVTRLGGVRLRVPAISGSLVTDDESGQICDVPSELQPAFIDFFGPQDMLQATTTPDGQLSFGLNGETWAAGASAVTVNYDRSDRYGGFDFKAIVLSPTSSGIDAVFIVELGGGAAEE